MKFSTDSSTGIKHFFAFPDFRVQSQNFKRMIYLKFLND